jgi:DNA-3-methyladenine glycosylase II
MMQHSNGILANIQEDELEHPNFEIRQIVSRIYERDPIFKKIETDAGALTIRRWSPGFKSLVRIILGQQLSTRSARAIFLRLSDQIELTPAQFNRCPDPVLRQAGLSRTKISTCKQLASNILTGQLRLDTLSQQADSLVIEELTLIKGIGNWTAEVYLLFCLDRPNSLPASDLAIQVGYQRLKCLEYRPKPEELRELTKHLEPYRGVAAHMLWHYYRFLSK